MSYESKCKEILDLFRASGKVVNEDEQDEYRFIPHEDSNMGRAVQILQTICDSQSHTIPTADMSEYEDKDDMEGAFYDIFEALETIESNIGDEFMLEFDGNEYRLIPEDIIWEVYKDEIQQLVEDCYSDVIKLDKIPNFIAVTIDWEQTAKNAYADGYGHTFSGYDGSEEESAGYYIFRTK
jgi:hypothetical protein